MIAGLLTVIAFFALGIGSAFVTVFMVKATDLINQYGNQIGIYAYQGGKFLVLTWCATGVMLIAVVAWCVECCVGRRVKNREWAEKPTGGMGWRGRRGWTGSM